MLRKTLYALLPIFALAYHSTLSQPAVASLSIADYGEDFKVKINSQYHLDSLYISQARTLPGMVQPLLFTQGIKLAYGKAKGNLVLLGSQTYQVEGFASPDSCQLAIYKPGATTPAGMLVVGPHLGIATSFAEAAKNLLDTLGTYLYNKSELKTEAWQRFRNTIQQYGMFLQDDWEWFAAVNRAMRQLPFSHTNLSKMSFSTFIQQLNSQFEGERPVFLSFPKKEVALLQISSFNGTGANIARCMDTVIAQGSRNLIIDLRNNTGGGAGAAMQPAKYLSPVYVPAGALVTNKWFDTTQRLPTPADYSQFYTFSNGTTQQLIAALSKHAGLVLATSPSPRQFTGKIYILTSQRTASTCEPLTYALQQRGHATVIGSHTAGAMLSAAAYYLPFGFMVSLPVADYYTYDGLRLEGHGVQPDIECPPQQALERCLLLID